MIRHFPMRFDLRRIGVAVDALLIASFLPTLLFPANAEEGRLARQAEEIRPLAPGLKIAREISGGEKHIYRISLTAGQFIQASLRQKGIDGIALIYNSTGKLLDDFTEPVSEGAVTKIVFIAQSDGDYHLLVRPRLKDAPSGQYQLTLDVVRPATEQDKILVRATIITKGANQTLRRTGALSGELSSTLTAKFEEALQLWRLLDDQEMIGECFLSLGNLNIRAGELTKALEFYEKALPLFLQTPEKAASQAITLNNMANVYLNLGELRKALDIFLKSLDLKKEEGRSRAITLDNIGAVYNLLGEYQLALDYHTRALASFRALGHRRDEAAALNNLAWFWENVGDPEKSVECLLQALPLVKEAGNKDEEARYLSNAGHFCFLMGNYQQAFEYANQALNLSRATNNHRAETGSLTVLCEVYPYKGEFKKALDACNRVLQASQGDKDRLHKATMLTALSRIFEQTGDMRKAIESREAALAVYREIGDPTGELTTLQALGQLALDGGDLVSARERIERAIEMTEALRVKVESHQLRSTYMASRQQVYESYIDLLMQMRKQEPEKGYERTALQVSERARARSLLDLLAESRVEIRRGADPALLEKERSLLERLNAKDAAWKQLRNNERMKRQADEIAREINEVNTQLQLVEARIRASSPRYAELTQPKSLTHAEIQNRMLDENTVLLEFALGKNRSWLWAVTPLAISTHQLPSRQEIETAARRFYKLLIARQPKKGETETEYQARVAVADEKFSQEAGAMSQMLLGPIAAKLDREWKGRRLLIVAGGALEYLPFAALPPPSEKTYQPLIASHEVVNLPSASVLAEIRRESAVRQPAAKTLAVFADPVFELNDPRVIATAKRKAPGKNLVVSVRSADASPASAPLTTNPDLARAVRSFNRAGFSRLPFSRDEADKIAEFVPKGSLLKATDFRANRTMAASDELSHYRIIHFATHGLLNSERPELSGLVLSLVDENGKAQDGFLRMREIFNLRLPADLVVLSACQTALGKETRGEGLVGLARGFIYAGADRVVASLWQVDDLATAQLMKSFYRGLLQDRKRPAAALRAAQLEMLRQKRWSSPYFWAGFIMQGEYK